MKRIRITTVALVIWLALSHTATAQTIEQLKAAAATFPPMPRGSADMIAFTGSLPTFASGAPFNDLEFTLLDTDYIDGENSGGDVFMPVDPSHPFPGSNKVKYVRCVLNTDLDKAYGSAKTDRIILGTHEIQHPFFRKGTDGIDNDYAVIQHLDFRTGYIQLKGQPEDYDLVYGTLAEGCQTEGWYLFYTADGEIDLIAFIFPCWDIESAISGEPPNDLNPLCNADSILSLTNDNHFKYAQPITQVPAVPDGIVQYGSSGKEIVSGITVDPQGFIYLFGCTDGNLDGNTPANNEIFVVKLSPFGEKIWVTELAMSEGTIIKDALADNQFVYAAGRTLGNLPGFTNAGRWDGILLKLDINTGAIVATNQWGNPGIDGYGNIAQDDAGNIFVSAQGAPPGPATTDDVYLVAKYRKSDLANVWRALNAPNVSGFKASAEAWGGLTYAPSGTPGQGRLVAGGWYFGPRGANAFVSIYENLHLATPTRPHSIIIDTPGTAADWVLDNTVDKNGNIYVAGFTTGNLGAAPLGEGDAYIIKYSPQLTNPIIRQFGTPKSDLIRKLDIDANGVLYATGYTYGNYNGSNNDPTQNSADIFIQKFDANLNFLEKRQIGTPHEDRGFAHLKNNTLYIGGMTEGVMTGSSHGSFDAFAFALNKSDLSTTQVDLITSVDTDDENTVNIYPNPAHRELNFTAVPESGFQIEVYTVAGLLMHTVLITPSASQVNVTAWPEGIYFIKTFSRGRTTTSKFIKL